MNIWNELSNNAFEYYKWFRNEENTSETKLSVFSVNANMIFSIEDKRNFAKICNEVILKIFCYSKGLEKHQFYLFAIKKVLDKSSKVERYKKIWKSLQSEYQFNIFEKNEELEIDYEGNTFFISIARFDRCDLLTALEIVSKYPEMYFIISSKENYMRSESIFNLFYMGLKHKERGISKVDYLSLSLNLCPKGDIVFRWGEASEEAEIAMILKRGYIENIESYI